MKAWTMPRLMRPKRTEYMCIAVWVQDDAYLEKSVDDLVGECMKQSGGSLDPVRLRGIWQDLKAEAGVKVE